jgi:hypothetical protein
LESPLPGGLASVVRFFLDFPQPLQIAGLVVAAIAVLVGAVFAWRWRAEIASWLATRPRAAYAWAAGIGGALVVAAAGAGVWGWNYVQHDNGFCTGCHVMGPAFVKFTESEHSQLECHDCHTQPLTASLRQLYLWVVERPDEIGPHAPVATEVCARCHIQEDPNETWQAISETLGHRVHLESDDPALASVECVTCHAPEVHRFAPTEETCAQAGCHFASESEIVLGRMAGSQTPFHCLGCHQYTAPRDGAGPFADGGIVPTIEQCGSCHEMAPIVSRFMPETDPHDAVCGACHNPHTQTTVTAAFETCAQAGCHADPESLTPFHRGLHQGVVARCATCHAAHDFVVEGSDCRSCHRDLS